MTTPRTPSRPRPRLKPRLRAVACLLLASLALAAGCGNQGGGVSLVSITAFLATGAETQTPTADAGQQLSLQAAVVNDANHSGAKFSLTGPGTLSTPVQSPLADSEQFNFTYTAPATVAAGSTAVVTITSNNTPTAAASLTITLGTDVVLTPATLPNGQVGQPYSQILTASGGTGAITLTTAGTLPTGLTLNGSTLRGTPSVFGTFTFTVTATDAATLPYSASVTYTVTILPQPPAITTTALPNGLVGAAYSQQLTFSGGGTATPVFAIASGTLPAGLTLSPSGLISGTPPASAAGTTSTFTVTVTVGTQTSAPAALSIAVPALPAVATTSLPSGNIGAAYKQQLSYTGGNGGTPVFALASGTLPSGLTLSTSGLIAGTPTAQQVSNFSVTVTVGPQTSAAQALSITVNGLIISSSPSAYGEAGLPFSFQLTAVGGTPPYKWTLAQGSTALPAGLTLNATTGLITGTPTTATGATPLTGVLIQATDSATPAGTATQALSFTIAAARTNVNNAQLKGTYAFLLQGFDANGNPLITAGNFTADGLGNVTTGTLDVNSTGLTAATTAATLSPTTYTVGADERGQMTLTYGAHPATFTLALNQITGGSASGGYLTEFDTTGQSRTGTFTLTTPTAFSTASLSGGYAFGVDGFAANSSAAAPVHRAAIGELQLTGLGGATSGELLLSSGGVTPIGLGAASVLFSVGPNGRGTLAVTLPNAQGTRTFAVYVVSATQFFLVSIDNASGTAGNAATSAKDLLAGTAYQQNIANGSFNASSLSATSVVRLERLNATSTGGFAPDVQIGLLGFNGAGALTLSTDENNGGLATTNTSTGAYTVFATGRTAATLATFSGIGGCTDCASTQTFFYLVGANRGFVMDFSAAVNSGYFEPQTATTLPVTATNANSSQGTLDPLLATVTSASGLFEPSSGQVVLVQDQNTAGLTLAPDQTSAFSSKASANGRLVLTPTSGPGSTVVYVISPTKNLELNTGSATPAVVEILHQ